MMSINNLRRLGLAAAVSAGVFIFTPWSGAASSDKEVPAPALPAIRDLKLEPASLTLLNSRDERRVVVLGRTEDNQLVDLTALAKFTTGAGCVEILESGYLRPKAKGTAEIIVKAAGQEAKLPVENCPAHSTPAAAVTLVNFHPPRFR